MIDERPGAIFLGDGRCRFVAWAPNAEKVEVQLLAPDERTVLLEPGAGGYHAGTVDGVEPGARYLLRLDGADGVADPASAFQPEGVHGPSEVVDPTYPWTDDRWEGLPLSRFVVYELHVGTFSEEGTFGGAIAYLDELVDIGVTAIEVMPVAQFPGARNWGYDGVFPSAVQNTYGGPNGLKRFVDACHRRGLACVLDVVYNHLGPEGAPHDAFGPYFSDHYRTPWGRAPNLDGPGSDGVREAFIASALRWFEEFHIDALRLDAIHGIIDTSAYPFLRRLADETRALASRLGRPLSLIAESDLNDPRVVMPAEHGGLGHDAMWSDDFHHSLHALLTGERDGHYADFGTAAHLASAYNDGFVYAGRYSTYRDRTHGASARGVPAERFVVCSQNHDQVGNRRLGERLITIAGFEAAKLAAGAVVLSPYIPLLFMGEEYGETRPFRFFVDHAEPALVDAVRRGRRAEFEAFGWDGPVPDPNDEGTWRASMLDRSAGRPEMRALYRALLAARRDLPALASCSRADTTATAGQHHVELRRRAAEQETLTILNAGDTLIDVVTDHGEPWRVVLDSADERFGGSGATARGTIEGGGIVTARARAFVLLERGGPVGGAAP